MLIFLMGGVGGYQRNSSQMEGDLIESGAYRWEERTVQRSMVRLSLNLRAERSLDLNFMWLPWRLN